MLGRIQSFTSCLATKTNIWTAKTVYYGKVGLEISKQVYAKEGLQPPTVAQFKQVYNNAYKKGLEYVYEPKKVVSCAQKLQRKDLVKYGALGIQLLGFYSLGEIIGRRHLVGYKSYTTHH
ncbi:hypothetical protein Kpol_274p6 [Vanderwaltozyma polyspora DSM 70294]|uniref:ATP synthase subunit g, mitochondrial n=1 Tax=Vanderwaltozyma polyspora (strain ATCC 22028 / DSM 70294 / BCRC 21397 / CBS 2163 / NBRC 10782 / NRRL Y-8283 / UCD 57-17) TaxID=436907 RepID=A7TT87_VANPO|nr:uncharacterized protein Kpol_274p6 [Vanderwaltozyma polyspora DSM 70294]EDO14523.1 hypothetical protein Kpol_274p6 [Vanderwaltozyma polyspora DSM 70294]